MKAALGFEAHLGPEIQLYNTPEFVMIHLAASQLGAVTNPAAAQLPCERAHLHPGAGQEQGRNHPADLPQFRLPGDVRGHVARASRA